MTTAPRWKEKDGIELVQLFVEKAKEDLQFIVDNIANEPKSVKDKLTLKLSTLSVTIGYPTWMSLGTDESVIRHLKGLYPFNNDNFFFFARHFGFQKGNYVTSLLKESCHNHKYDMLVDPLSPTASYSPLYNSVFVPISLVSGVADYITNIMVTPCERAAHVIQFITKQGKSILRAMLMLFHGRDSRYDGKGVVWKDMPNIFNELHALQLVRVLDPQIHYIENTKVGDEVKTFKNSLMFELRYSTWQRVYDFLELHFSYYVTMKIIKDLTLEVKQCIGKLDVLFLHEYAVSMCDAPSMEYVKMMYGRGGNFEYLPGGIRLNVAYSNFPPFRDTFKCEKQINFE
eukprot:GHVR01077071.1.p1 GENE.GHVR01077071.1~~GHVR01077071.1.p1  ORF type:complete len:343 (-),score=57.90 GHVR01077071.1:213-1241(-)